MGTGAFEITWLKSSFHDDSPIDLAFALTEKAFEKRGIEYLRTAFTVNRKLTRTLKHRPSYRLTNVTQPPVDKSWQQE
jgi:hypothetical protein